MIKGKGTAENPYIIMTADDLYFMSSIGGSDVYFSLGADIDFNNTPYADNFRPITLDCKHIAGNGHVIRNVNYVVNGSDASMFVLTGDSQKISVENLYIENIRLTGKNVFLFGNTGENNSISLRYCTIIMNDITASEPDTASETHKHCILHGAGIEISADYCMFVIKSSSKTVYPYFSGDTITHSQMNFEIFVNDFVRSTGGYNSVITESDVSDSYFFVNITTSKISGLSTFDFSSKKCVFSGCYLVCEVSSLIYNLYWYGNIITTCFYDVDVLRRNNTVTSVNGDNIKNIYKLTTEQCKDAEYLRSIGFSCTEAYI
ncbi:MAG: hypothetical protein K2G36_06350 [Ruminococcus sp.]|nr:hypothetical protein [Ruminococcus sp.]